jgi:5,5'-dehydrodivanillate O-demethylase oxygenase subunit
VLSAEKNRLLTQVGPGTPMGELLRRYWMPIGGASGFDDNPIKPIRLLGEDLVLYKDQGGRFGLLDRHCPHRRAGTASSSPMTTSSIRARAPRSVARRPPIR